MGTMNLMRYVGRKQRMQRQGTMSADIKNCPALRISERRKVSEQFLHLVEKSISPKLGARSGPDANRAVYLMRRVLVLVLEFLQTP